MRCKELTLYNPASVCILSLYSSLIISQGADVAVGKQRNTRANLKFFSKPKGVFSVNELYSLLDFKYTRQKQKSLNIWNMRPPKRAPISKTKVAKSYKNSLTKWPYCHIVLSHTNPSSLCYTNKGNLFDPLHPNNNIDILNTDLSIFAVVMIWRNCLTIWSF